MANVLIYSIQAEAEELARRVDTLTSENLTLKSEINKLTGNSEKLRMENATLKVMQCSHNIPTPWHLIGTFVILNRYFWLRKN